MKYKITVVSLIMVLSLFLISCNKEEGKVKIGVSFGAGPAVRWDVEREFMLERAEELDVEMDMRLNRTDEPKTQKEDCFEMIDNGIDVLIIMPRNVDDVGDIIQYAEQKNVPVISYARVILNQEVDLFVGYDSERIGQRIGQYLSETVYSGDYIILSGDEQDNNATLLYRGAMRYIDPIRENINILLETPIASWSPDVAKELVREAILQNDGKVDAILAPNDKLAGACAEVIAELQIEESVIITGMDAELDAIRRIVAGTQSMTVYMSFKDLARTAVDEAYHMAKGEKININTQFDNGKGGTIPSNLITGQVVTKENIDRILIDDGYYTHEEVYSGQ